MSTDRAPALPDPALPPLPWEAADIMTILPHRYPFLLIDRVVEIEPGQRVVAMRNVTANEPQFTGHFPGRPIMPGVLLVESLAQAGAVRAVLPANRGQAGPVRGHRRLPLPAIVVPGRHVAPGDHRREARRVSGRARGVATVEVRSRWRPPVVIMPRDQDIAGGRLAGADRAPQPSYEERGERR